MGMVRWIAGIQDWRGGSPHARGDGPMLVFGKAGIGKFSPRAWGWSDMAPVDSGCSTVLPTRVGMVLPRNWSGTGPELFSPRAWGWSGAGSRRRGF